jgi:hypothetical protein
VPTLLRVGPYRFFMVMFDCFERPHIHVRGGSIGEAKFWLSPSVSLANASGYTRPEIERIQGIVTRNAEVLLERWVQTCRETVV